ncbi:MAG: outer membrane beta-barrel protein [Chitinispirillales bacterium]|jgi:hypothetical protein|nr:outer membrane beta-barrel protein [Chitinispirillales bacterium]
MKNSFKICALTAVVCVSLAFAWDDDEASEPARIEQEASVEETAGEEQLASKVDSLSTELSAVKTELDTAKAELKSVKIELETVKTELSAAKTGLEANGTELENVKTELSILKDGKSYQHHIGFRFGAGVSALRGHKALKSDDFVSGNYAIILKPNCAAGLGLVYGFDLNERFTLGAEVSYSYYSAHGEYSVRKEGVDFGDLNVAGVSLHALEFPVLIRANVGNYYSELGPLFGYNFYTRMYKNSDLKKPYLNRFAVGITVGTGIKINNCALLGVRANFGFLEYAEEAAGVPWSVQASVTKFLF